MTRGRTQTGAESARANGQPESVGAPPERILVVDDAPDTLELLTRNLGAAGYQVQAVARVSEAIALLEHASVDLVITDYKMPEISGLDLIRHVRENHADVAVMMITGFASISGAVEAMSLGAAEYLPKPFTEEELLDTVGRVLARHRLERAAAPEEETGAKEVRFGIIGRSPAMSAVFGAIEKAARTSATVLIAGESGTGKELVARAIHYHGARSAGTFVPVNCGGIPETLLESEMFGHVRGAFTGATEERAGFFQTADGGTIFLDEIGEMSVAMQVKLLRVLQDKAVVPVGASRPRQVDVRIIAATNRDLEALVRKGGFREDLYYRLNVVTITMPPLREREDDVLLLAHHFIATYAAEAGRPAPELAPRAADVLRGYGWPGNVRELENVVQRIVVMTEGTRIDVPDLPSLMRFSALRGKGLDRTLEEVELEYIVSVLASVEGNKSRAAQILGIDRKTLRERLARLEERR